MDGESDIRAVYYAWDFIMAQYEASRPSRGGAGANHKEGKDSGDTGTTREEKRDDDGNEQTDVKTPWNLMEMDIREGLSTF